MLDMYATLKNSLATVESALRIAVSNANNFNTPGHKQTTATFATILGEVFSPGTETVNPQGTGGGVTIGSTTRDYSQGAIGIGSALDVAIRGEGFLLLSESPVDFGANANKVYTRNGQLQIDFSGTQITDSFGRKVFGFEVNAQGNRIGGPEPVAISTKGFTDVGFIDGGVLVGNFNARQEAIVNGDPNPPEHVPLFKLALGTVPNKQGLFSAIDGSGALEASVAAGQPLAPQEAGVGVYGQIISESIETSNVNVARVSLDMSIINRQISSIQGMIQDVNGITKDLISKLTA